MQRIPDDDPIARVLRDHYETEAADAGLRSIDLSGSGGGRSATTPDAAAVSRVPRQAEHRRVREALSLLSKLHQDALALAYGVSLREFDPHDEKRAAKRKKDAQRDAQRDERGWRTRLRARLPSLGSCAAAIMVAPSILRSFELAPRGEGAAEWLASGAPRVLVDQAAGEALEILSEARKAFARAYAPRSGPRLDQKPPRRTRSIDKDEIRRRIAAEEARG